VDEAARDHEPTLHDHPLYPWVRQLQASRGRELLERHGAHGLDIDWVDQPGGDPAPGLVFHVAADRLEHEEPVPATIEVADATGRRQRVRTRVEMSPPPRFE
jgi:hypothetical protein